jgi:signal transduction histidine kinase/ligand-binding sensor domain-containing protein
MNLQLLEPAIAPHISGTRQWCASRSVRLVISLFAVWLFATAAFALNPQKSITQFAHAAWTEKDGAPADIVAITQTSDGYLWLGTPTGLYSFDGVRFAHFEPRAGEDLPAKTIRSLLATRDGGLWIVFTSGDIYRLLDGHVASYSEREGFPGTLSLAECRDGSLIAGTAKGLARFKNGVWTDVPKVLNFPGKQARLVYFDRENTLWVVTEDRIVHLSSGQKQFVDLADPVNAVERFDFAEAPDGAIWIADTDRSARTVRRSDDLSPMTEVRVGASWVLFDRNGGLWVSSLGDGLRRVAHPDQIRGHQIAQFGPEAEQFTRKDGLSGNDVSALFEDREGNIWSASTRGLDRFRESAFTSVSVPDPDISKGLLGTRDGSIWAFGNAGILRIGPGGDQKVMTKAATNSMLEDESGALLGLGATYSKWENVVRFQQGRFVNVIPSEHSLPGGTALKNLWGIASDREGGLWMFDVNQGLFRLANGTLKKIASQSESLFLWGVLYADRNDRIWVGQYDRVALYDHGNSQVFGTSDGVPAGVVCTIYHDRAGNVWVGGRGGLSKFENGRFRPLSTTNGLPTQSVIGMIEDDQGYWWLATEVGVLRIPAGELDRAVANPAYRIRYESFDTLDGLPGKTSDLFPMPLVVHTPDGRIWVSTNNGIAYVDPRHIPKNDLSPPVHVETIKVDDKVVAPEDGIVLNHNTKDIEIDYTALSLSIPERVLFRYKLDGYDTEWQQPGTRRQAFYNGLSPGKYKFHVIACNNDGVWNESGATLDFRVMPAWYQTIWFRVLCVACFVLLLWALYQLRLQQLQWQFSMALEARVSERTRIARELHDTLLQSFQGLMLRFQTVDEMLPARPMDAKKALECALNRGDQAISEGRDAITDIRASTLANQDLAKSIIALMADFGEELSEGNGASVLFQVLVEGTPRTVRPTVQGEIYSVARESLGNAFRHAQAQHIETEITYGESLRLRFRDDGIGIDSSVIEDGGRPGHWGLLGIRERARQIGAQLEIWSELGAGTEIELSIPGSIAYEVFATKGRFRIFPKRMEQDYEYRP